jgi:hypothetical protein
MRGIREMRGVEIVEKVPMLTVPINMKTLSLKPHLGDRMDAGILLWKLDSL